MRKKLVSLLLVAAAGMALLFSAGTAPASASIDAVGKHEFVGYDINNTGLNKFFDQSAAAWGGSGNAECLDGTLNYRSCLIWAGVQGNDNGTAALFQAGVIADHGAGEVPQLFYEVPSGRCKSAAGDGSGEPQLLGVNVASTDAIIARVDVVDDGHLEAFFSVNGTAYNSGLIPCSYAWTYHGVDAFYLAERACIVHNTEMDGLSQFNDGNITGAKYHLTSEGQSVWHWLSEDSNQSQWTPMTDSSGHTLATAGSLSNTNTFPLDWVQAGNSPDFSNCET